jgi:hypothetical protein
VTGDPIGEWRARELLELGSCSAACLLARDAFAACTCVCGGEYHGTMADLPVPEGECPHVRLMPY